MTRTVYLLRHGERADDVNPRWMETAPRRHDPPLTGVGVDQARRTGRFLADAGIDHVFASPFLRAVHTAHHLAARLGDLRVRLEPGLSEHLNPDWFDRRPTLLAPARLADRFDTVRLDHDPLVDPTFPEPWPDCRDRVGETVRRLLDATAGTLLLVGHGATVGGGIEAVTGRVVEDAAPYCGLSRLHRDVAGWELTYAGRRA
jgi:broad specificity phosphatase PhoE